MIHYDLRCSAGHAFDGWFRDSATFDQQAMRGLIECPECADTKVERALMAPRLSRNRRVPVIDGARDKAGEKAGSAGSAAASPAVADPGPPPMPVPDQVRAVLQRIRAEVEQKCTYVGGNFADEARRMHAGETPSKPIYGEATKAQAEALEDDGIAVSRIPWVPRADS
jgi:hypothetical protein